MAMVTSGVLFRAIGKTLRSVRTNLKYSLDDVSDGSGISKSKISEVETGKVSISLVLFATLTDFYGVSMDYVVGRSTDPIEARGATTYAKFFRGMMENHLNAMSVMAASAVVQSRSGIDSVAAFEVEGRKIVDSFDRFVAANPDFEDMRCGATIAARIDDLRKLLKEQSAAEIRLKVSNNPKLWVDSVRETKKILGDIGCELGEVDAGIVNRAISKAAHADTNQMCLIWSEDV